MQRTMSNRSSGSAFASSLASDESYIGTLPIVSLIEDTNAYTGSLFETTSKTINDLLKLDQLKSERGEIVDRGRSRERENLLSSFLHRIAEALDDISDMRKADFAALSMVWGNGAGESTRCCL